MSEIKPNYLSSSQLNGRLKEGMEASCKWGGVFYKGEIEVRNGSVSIREEDSGNSIHLGILDNISLLNYQVTEFQILNRTIEDGLFEGDIIGNGDSERKILGVIGKDCYLLSSDNDFKSAEGAYTLKELLSDGYKLLKPETVKPKTVLTMDDIAKLAKCSVEDLHIEKG